MAKNEIRTDLLPYKAGIVRIVPLDKYGVADYAKAYTTLRNFMVSTQASEGRTTETVANGNGQDAEYPTGNNYTLAVGINVYDPKFHALLAGTELLATPTPILIDGTAIPKAAGEMSGSEVTYTFTKNFPVKLSEGDAKEWIEVKDVFGNIFTDISGAEEPPALGEKNFKYDSSKHQLSFDKRYADQIFNINYYILDATAETYSAPDTPAIRTFQVETMGEMVSADTGEVIRVYQKIARATVSGDLPNVTTQKQKQNTITYNLKSAPTPSGISPFVQTFSSETADGAVAAAATVQASTAKSK